MPYEGHAEGTGGWIVMLLIRSRNPCHATTLQVVHDLAVSSGPSPRTLTAVRGR